MTIKSPRTKTTITPVGDGEDSDDDDYDNSDDDHDHRGNADENNDCDCSHRGKRIERAMFKVQYCSLSLRLLWKLLKIQRYIRYNFTALKESKKASGYAICNE